MDPNFFSSGCYQRTLKVLYPNLLYVFSILRGDKMQIITRELRDSRNLILYPPLPFMIWLSLIPLSVKICLASKDAPILSPDPTRLLTSAIDKVLVATSSNRHKWVFPSRHQSNLSTPWNLETLSSGNKNKLCVESWRVGPCQTLWMNGWRDSKAPRFCFWEKVSLFSPSWA